MISRTFFIQMSGNAMTTQRKLVLSFLLWCVVPLPLGLLAVGASASYWTSTNTVTDSLPCGSIVSAVTKSGYPLPWIITSRVLYTTGGCQFQIVGFYSANDWTAFFLDLLFYIGIYYGASLSFLGAKRLAAARKSDRNPAAV